MGIPEDPATLIADLVVHSLRVKFETILRGAVARSVKGFLDGRQGALLPDMRKLLTGVIGSGDNVFQFWNEDLESESWEEQVVAEAVEAIVSADGEGGELQVPDAIPAAWFAGGVDF
jgi:hypothetical protein